MQGQQQSTSKPSSGSKRKAANAGAQPQPQQLKLKKQRQAEGGNVPTKLGNSYQNRQPDSSAVKQPGATVVPAAARAGCGKGKGADQAQNLKTAQTKTAVAVAAAAAAQGAAAKPQDDDVRRLFRSWAWKREHRPDKDRFHRPYVHTMSVPDSSGQPQQVSLTIKQQKFSSEGFASTVWDSSIVMAKYLEKLGPNVLSGKRCLDLSAGCGLVGIAMAKLGATVTVTDLAGNLSLLQHNCKANGVPDVAVLEHRWGEDTSALQPPFDFIVACDVMYVHEFVQPLLQSLLALSSSSTASSGSSDSSQCIGAGDSSSSSSNNSTTVLIAHGRNRPAEPAFKAAAAEHFSIELVRCSELDEVYQCSDVDVLRLTRL